MERPSNRGQVLIESVIFILSISLILGVFRIYEDSLKKQLKKHRWEGSSHARKN